MLEDARKDMRKELESVDNLGKLLQLFIDYNDRKERVYEGSWAKRGLSGYLDGCLLRQMDRVEPLFEWLLSGDYTSQDVLDAFDTLYDVGMYAFMGIRLMAAYFPDLYGTFKQSMELEVDGVIHSAREYDDVCPSSNE